LVLALTLLGWCGSLPGEEKAPAKDRLRPAGIEGTLLLCGKSVSPAAVQRFVELAGGEKAHLVVLSAGDKDGDKGPTAEELLKTWKAHKVASVVAMQADSRKTATETSFAEPLSKATAVWIECAGSEARLVELYQGTAVEKELADVLKRGGILGGPLGGAAALAQGFHLLPDMVVSAAGAPGKVKAGLVGIGLEDKAALVIQGREMRVLGEPGSGNVLFRLAGALGKPASRREVKPGGLADLTQLRRAALARTQPPFPPRELGTPEVPKGSLVIVGGGAMPADVTAKFIELAGGPDALIVVLPTAQPDPVPAAAEAAFLMKAGAKNVKVLPGRDLKDVEDPKNLEVLEKAGGIWFGGGRQWRFVDAYEGTKALELFREVLRRGSVIGGSSAGATIQGDYLCRGNPLGNTQMSCEGYERGLGFLPGVTIDQHFAQRKRFDDMAALIKTYPQLLGIGLDEATAIIVQGHTAEVMGRGQAHFFDRKKTAEEGKAEYDSFKAGEKYDLKARKMIKTDN
jgi:cyanophycinase